MGLRNKYTEEFRRETADYVISTGRPIAEIARELDLNVKTVNRWVLDRKGVGSPAKAAQESELRKAHKRIHELEKENEFLKKAAAFFAKEQAVKERYQFIFAQKANYSITMMTQVLKVSRSGYYSWIPHRFSLDPYKELKGTIINIWKQSDKRFGARSIYAFLPDEFKNQSLYRIRKCMRELGIKGCSPYKSKRTTIPSKGAKPKPDLIKRNFTSPIPTYKLVGDITYLRTGQGWLYLASVIDLNTRMVVGWSLSKHMTADIVVEALACAKNRGFVAENAIFHSDKGAQYTSRKFALWAKNNNVRLSCSRTGNCYDNAVAESFFATLKNEMYYRKHFATRKEAKNAVIEFIEIYYNRNRPHSTIDYQIPADVMNAFFERNKRREEKLLKAA